MCGASFISFLLCYLLIMGLFENITIAANIDMRAVIGPRGSSGRINSGMVSGEFVVVLCGVFN